MTDTTYALAMLVLAGVAVNVYPFVYLTRPWTTTPAGRALMVKAWGNLVLIDMSLAAWLWPDYPGRWLIRNIGLTLFTVGVWALLLTLMRADKRGETDKRSDPTRRRTP